MKPTLTVHRQFYGNTLSHANGVLYQTAVSVVIGHQDSSNGEDFLIMGEDQPRVIDKRLVVLHPCIDGLSAILVGTVEREIFTQLQHS